MKWRNRNQDGGFRKRIGLVSRKDVWSLWRKLKTVGTPVDWNYLPSSLYNTTDLSRVPVYFSKRSYTLLQQIHHPLPWTSRSSHFYALSLRIYIQGDTLYSISLHLEPESGSVCTTRVGGTDPNRILTRTLSQYRLLYPSLQTTPRREFVVSDLLCQGKDGDQLLRLTQRWRIQYNDGGSGYIPLPVLILLVSLHLDLETSLTRTSTRYGLKDTLVFGITH